MNIDQRAEAACRVAKKLEKAGEYHAAIDALIEFWPDQSKPPDLSKLGELRSAEVLLRLGAVAGWLGAAEQTEGSQEQAKDLLTKSIVLFDQLGITERVAEARGDLALCYWREGSYDEARINLRDALSLLDAAPDSELTATLLIRSSIVEMQTQRLQEAKQYCERAARIVEESDDHALKGSFHNQYALVLRQLATPENQEHYLDRALIEYAAASIHYEKAGNRRAVARVEANLGFLHFTIGRYNDAHEHLNRARGLFLQLKDVGTAAQVDETRARTLLAEGRLREAERLIKGAVKVLERGGQQAVLTEALTTHGAIAARMSNYARADALLRRAISVAETVGDREGSGRAHLTIVEELGRHTPLEQLSEIYGSAAGLLRQSQDPAANQRLVRCARKVIDMIAEEISQVSAPDLDSWTGFSFRTEIQKIEKVLIERALRDTGGSVTKASQLLGFKHHQSLIGLINSRHRELLPRRSTVRRRRRHLFSEPKRSKKKDEAAKVENQLIVLHVEDHKPVTRVVKDALGGNYSVQSCANGLTALELLKTKTPVNVLIVDNNLPGISGLELILRVRSLAHRGALPVIMLSGDDVETEAWRAGVDAFLPKSKAAAELAGTVEELVKEKQKDAT